MNKCFTHVDVCERATCFVLWIPQLDDEPDKVKNIQWEYLRALIPSPICTLSAFLANNLSLSPSRLRIHQQTVFPCARLAKQGQTQIIKMTSPLALMKETTGNTQNKDTH